MVDFVAALRVESDRFFRAVDGVDLSIPVPSCPGWNAADLIWHLAEVQHFWAAITAGGLMDPEQVDPIERPDESGLLERLLQSSDLLLQALQERDPSDPCWTWAEDQTVGFVRRRQAHEALIHRVDGEATAGHLITPINSDLAADGIDEILRVMIGTPPGWGEFVTDGTTIRIEAPDAGVGGATWGVAFGRFSGTSPTSGIAYDSDAAAVGDDAGEPDTIIRGPAADLDRWLWGRGPAEPLQVDGDRRLVQRLRDLASETTQ